MYTQSKELTAFYNARARGTNVKHPRYRAKEAGKYRHLYYGKDLFEAICARKSYEAVNHVYS